MTDRTVTEPPELSGIDSGIERLAGLSAEKRALLALELARRRAAAAPARIQRQRRDGDPCRFPASPGQQRLWFLHELDPDATAYLLPIALRLRGALDVDALRATVGWLVERHEALRTGFEIGPDGVVTQVVHGNMPVAVGVEDVTSDGVTGRIRALLAGGFDVRVPPLLRSVILRVTDSPGPDAAGQEWVLVLAVHHIVVDGWSLGLLVEDLHAGYTAFAAGTRPALPAPELQYADYAVWQHATAADLLPQLEHWRGRLAGAEPLELPADRPVGGVRSFDGDAVPVRLPAGLVERLRRLGDAENATPFMVLAAAFAVVLGRWSGQHDVLIGTPVAGRGRVELESVVGFFVNTLPLRVRLADGEPFRELLRTVRDTCTGAYANQDVPFDRIAHEAGGRPAGLVRVMLALRDVALPQPRLPGVHAEVIEVPSGGAQLDLGLELAPSPDGGLTGWLEFATDLFERATAHRIADAVGAVLNAVVADPDLAVRDLPVLTEQARRELMAWGRRSGEADPHDPQRSTVARWFESTVDRTAHAVALVDDATGVSLRYRELDERANRLAGVLRRRGVGAEGRVAVCLDRGVELVVALLAVLKSGAVYLPIDPAYPPARLAAMLADAAPRLVLTTAAYAEPLPTPAAPVIRLDALTGELAGQPADRPNLPVFDDQAAYLLFTSGSTGRPKGVLNTHAALANRLRAMIEQDGLGGDERVLAKTPVGFDPSLTELLAPLLAGARLVLAAPGRHGDPGYLLDTIERHRVTSVDFVPSMLGPVLDRPDAAARMATLRRLYCGGEPLPAELARRFLAAVPGAQLINLYGPTEAAVDVSSYRVSSPVPDRLPIGRPLAGVELYVLDERLRLSPIGVPGQLYIGGIAPARGYLGDPAMTAARFVPHPFPVAATGRRLYATGDRVRWLADGNLEFLGRQDGQVKIRGTRVEPGEVEAALRQHPQVADAVVVARGDRLVAYLVATGPMPGMRAFLRERLPPAMVPASFVTLESFPLTPGGKLDRAALPDPAPAGSSPGRKVPPSGPLETVLAGLWAELLDVDEVGVLDDFHDLGGHSLLATRVVARTGNLFRLQLSLRDFVQIATVREFAGLLRAAGAAAAIDVDRVAAVIIAVSAMSPDEVAAKLRPAGGGAAMQGK